MSPGGVGRNIAHNMSLMGLDVRLLTAFGDDVTPRSWRRCGELGIDISQSPVIPGRSPSTIFSSTTSRGDMQLAVSDMDIYRNLTPRVLAGRKQLLEGSQVVVIDTNLPAESIAWLADNCHAPIFCRPRVHGEGREAAAGAGKAPHPEAKPAGGGAAVRRALSRIPTASTVRPWTLLETGLHRCSSHWEPTASMPPIRAAA